MNASAPAPATASMPTEQPKALLLRGHEDGLLGTAATHILAAPADALGAQAAALLATLPPQARLAGAVPFDRETPCHLLAVQAHTQLAAIDAWLQAHAESSSSISALPMNKHREQPYTHQWILTAEPKRAFYEDSVARCLRLLQASAANHATDSASTAQPALRKVVLARTLRAQARHPINPWWLAHRLGADPHVLRFVVPLPAAAGEAPAWLVGATPERLLARRGAQVLSEPLAGSAARLPDAAASKARADALLHSAKDHQEHRYVVQAIADLLAPLCKQLHVPEAPSLYATGTMWHLGTRIEGELKNASPCALADTSSVALAALLHPTPAVGGTPRAQAMQTIAELEPVSRGFYAGAVGWCNALGDGDWHVSLRCAHVQGHQARLFAGAGIVADSIPASEGAETRAKFGAMLDALGMDAHVSPLL